MNLGNTALSVLFAILIALQSVQPFPARARVMTLPAPPPLMTRHEIRAARDKFDRKLKLDKKRPWDGMNLTGPHTIDNQRKPDK
jgi:hypothetical protein